MYKIMIKKGSQKDVFEWFTVDGEIWSADNLEELSNQYKGLLETFPSSKIVPIQELDTEILVNIEDV